MCAVEVNSEYNEKEIKFVCDYCHIDRATTLAEGEANKAAASALFEALSQQGVKVRDVKGMCGYFVFVFGLSSVYHFHVKGLSNNWKFGMWINSLKPLFSTENNDCDLDKPFVQLFCQRKEMIDKFKPSRSDMLVEMSYRDWQSVVDGNMTQLEWFADDVSRMVKFIHKHPILAYDGYCNSTFLSYRPIKYVVKNTVWGRARSVGKKVARSFLTYYSLHKAIKIADNYPDTVYKVACDLYSTSTTPNRAFRVVIYDDCIESEVTDMVREVFPNYPDKLDDYGDQNFCFTFQQGEDEYTF